MLKVEKRLTEKGEKREFCYACLKYVKGVNRVHILNYIKMLERENYGLRTTVENQRKTIEAHYGYRKNR